MIEDRFVHQSPFEYEYEYRFTEYEYDEDRNALMPERWPLKMTCDAISSSPKTINPGALALSTSPTTASSSSTASLALTIGKPSVRFASSTNANYPRSSPRPKSKSFFASSTSCPQATELDNRGSSTHTLRHCYATHLLEAGVSLKAIQKYLGHKSLNTTMIFLYLTTVGEEHAIARINDLMKRLGNNDAHTR